MSSPLNHLVLASDSVAIIGMQIDIVCSKPKTTRLKAHRTNPSTPGSLR
jgi:hypothetical protein